MEIDYERKAPFTFIWAIENSSTLHISDRISSPVFTVESMESTKWQLEMEPDHETGWISLGIRREKEDVHPQCMELKIELAFLGANGLHLMKRVNKKHMTKDTCMEFDAFAKSDEIFFDRRKQYLPKDTLTIRCRMWRIGTFISTRDSCFARTHMGVDRRFLTWVIKDFSSLKPGDKKVRVLNATAPGAPQLILTLFLDEYDRNLHIKVKRRSTTKDHWMRAEISALNVEGHVLHTCNTYDWIKEDNEIVSEFRPFLTENRLRKQKEFLLENDVLYLRCELEIDVGPAWSRIETDIHLPFSDFNDNVTEDDGVPTVCCPFKNAVKRLYEDKAFSDVVLKCASETFPAHKSILSARSPVFNAMFTNNMKENIDNCVEISDLSTDTLNSLLSYIYTDTVPELHEDRAIDLYLAADMYELLDLRKCCSDILKADLSAFNVCNILVLAHMHHDEELLSFVHYFILRNDEDILNSKIWKQFKRDNTILATETMENLLSLMKRTKRK